MKEKDPLAEMMKYCAAAEHCTSDVLTKLKRWDLSDDEINDILEKLRKENFLDDTRYATNYVREKWNLHRWGRVKIRHHLQEKNIPETLIDAALTTIPEESYLEYLEILLAQKRSVMDEPDEHLLKGKLSRFAVGQGFEEELVENKIEQGFI